MHIRFLNKGWANWFRRSRWGLLGLIVAYNFWQLGAFQRIDSVMWIALMIWGYQALIDLRNMYRIYRMGFLEPMQRNRTILSVLFIGSICNVSTNQAIQTTKSHYKPVSNFPNLWRHMDTWWYLNYITEAFPHKIEILYLKLLISLSKQLYFI